MNKIQAIRIDLKRIEGPWVAYGDYEERERITVEPLWETSDEVIQRWAMNSTLDKMDYTITFANARTYMGRIEITQEHRNETGIVARAMLRYLEFHGGRHPADWMGVLDLMDWNTYRDKIMGTVHQESCIQWIDNYQIGPVDLFKDNQEES